jgi:ubiquinone/menaquinone biosynthesis C-methylase UbiE
MSGFDDLQLDNPTLVSWEFASEERLEARNAIYRQLTEGINAEELILEALREVGAKNVLEVGCGAGVLTERITKEQGASVIGLDSSQRMVDLTRDRGIPAQLGDVQELPFDDGSFDCVVAGWLFYHVPDRERAIAQCARVLVPGGTLVAATLADDNLSDLWELLGSPQARQLTFSTTNGAAQLEPFFARVEAREAEGLFVFPTAESMRTFVAASIREAHLASAVPASFSEPVRVRTHHTVFVATKAAA